MKRVKGRFIKLFLIFITSLILFILAGAFLFVYFFPKEKLLDLIITNTEKSLNRKIKIEQIDYGFSGIILQKLIIYDGNSIEDPVLARADYASLGLSILPLIKKELNINQVYFNNLRINIQYNGSSISNIEKLIKELADKGNQSAISTKISSIKLDNALITLKNPPGHLKQLSGDYGLNCTIKLDKDYNPDITNCRITLPESRGVIYPEIKIKTGDDVPEITGNIGLEKVSLSWVHPRIKGSSIPFQTVSGDLLNIKIAGRMAEGFIKASAPLLNSKKIVFADGYCKVNLEKKTVFISNLNCKIRTSILLISNLLLTTTGKLISFDINNIDIYITDIKPLLNFIPGKLYGKVRGKLSSRDGLYSGTLNLINLGYDSMDKVISGINTSLSIENNLIKKENIPVKIYGFPCYMSIALTDEAMRKIYINLNAEKIIIGSAGKKSAAPVNIPFEIIGKISINNIQYDQYNLSRLKLYYNLSGKKISIKRFSAGFMDGNIQGKGIIFTSAVPPKASASIRFNRIKVQNALALSDRFKKRFFGRANGKADVNFLISDNIINTIHGKVEFSINKGKIVNTGIQNGLGIWLSELKYKLRDLEFNKIYGNFDVKGSKYILNVFIFNSEDIRLKMQGAFNRKLIATNMNIYLEFTNHFIKDLPRPVVTIKLNNYLKGKWYIIPFKINGDITNSKNIKMLP